MFRRNPGQSQILFCKLPRPMGVLRVCPSLLQAYQMHAVIFVIDGIDEAGSASELIQRWILSELLPSGNRLVVTSRPEG
jgi:hypothetical protein|eukprot:4859500-Prymnesium_polylepis.2